jgi:thiamine biosynthesis lipoprotein
VSPDLSLRRHARGKTAAGLCFALVIACRPSPEPPAAAAPPDAARAATAPAPPPPPRIFTIERKCMGTKCQVKAFHPDEQLVQRAVERGMAEMDRIEALTTSWTEDSDVARINHAAGKEAVKVAPDTMAVVKKGLWVAALSHGAFDITVGVFKGLWKFDEDNDDTIPDFAEVRRRVKLVNYRDVIVDDAAGTVKLRREGQRLNLEGLAKGYGVQAAVAAIRAAGLEDFIFKAGGDLFASGKKGDREWRVGIQDPRAPRESRIIFELPVVNQAFNTSGDYERFVIKDGVRYHHILDARTGFPARGCRSVTILAPDAFLADTVDTAIFAAGPVLGMKMLAGLPGVEAVIVDAKNHVLVTPGLRDKLVKRGDPTPGI